MHVALVLTHDCNLACSYCYAGAKEDRSMPAETVDAALEFAFAQPGDVDLGFFGGEPLLAWGRLVEIAERAETRARAENRGLRLSVTTNGTLITPARARWLAAHDFDVAISLDGDRIAHDAARPLASGKSSFAAVERGARRLVDAGIPLDVIAVVTPANAGRLGESARALADLGAFRITFNPCYEVPWSDDDLDTWERGLGALAEFYLARMRAGHPVAIPTLDNKLLAAAKGGLDDCDACGVGTREVAVAPSGRLYPCARLVGEDRDERFAIGNVRTGIDVVRVATIARGPSDPSCDPCAERWRCTASCVCANLAETGESDKPGGVQCWHERTTARVADAVGAQLLAEGSPTFLAWIYRDFLDADRIVPPAFHRFTDEPTGVRSRRRLPVLKERVG